MLEQSQQFELELRLERTRACDDPAAFFIPGSDTNAWFAEIARWEVESSRLSLAIVASGPQRTLGLMVWSDQKLSPAEAKNSIPYARPTPQLLIPIDAQFQVALRKEQLAALVPEGFECLIWHPAAGLIGVEPTDVLQPADLLSRQHAQNKKSISWSEATPGIVYPHRLQSLRAAPITTPPLPDAESEFGASADDDASSSDQLPPSQDSMIQRALDGFREKLANSVSKLAGGQPSCGDTGHVGEAEDTVQSAAAASGGNQQSPESTSVGWMQKLKDWANRVTGEISQKRRQDELSRLLEMLETNPDAGLRKAISFNRRDDFRGLSHSNFLADRDPVFGSTISGAMGDNWHVAFDMKQKLMSRYRELADRELRLKRYRRAAYIFAELLGEYESAAKALEAGGFYLEAAAVFRDELDNPLAAAECFERGGLFHQAIEIFGQFKEFEEVARLYTALDQNEQAETHWRLAIDSAKSRREYIRAAELARSKLNDRHQAGEILRTGWLADREFSRACLRQWFKLMSRDEDTDEVVREIESLRGETKRPSDAVQVLVQVVRQDHRARVKQNAKETVRLIIAEQLAKFRTEDLTSRVARQWLEHIRVIEPTDLLLSRDCDRFVAKIVESENEHHRMQTRSSLATSPAKRTRSITSESTWRLPVNQQVVKAASTLQALHLVTESLGDSTIHLWRIPWNNTVDIEIRRHRLASWELRESETPLQRRLLLAPDPRDERPPLVHIVGERPLLMPKSLLGWPYRASRRAVFLDEDSTLGVAQDRSGMRWHFGHSSGHFKVESFDENDIPIHGMFWNAGECVPEAAHCHVEHQSTFILEQDRLWLVKLDSVDGVQSRGLIDGVTDYAISPARTKCRIIAADESGVTLIYSHDWNIGHRIVRMRSPLVTFTCDASVVCANTNRCVVVHRRGNLSRVVAESDWTQPGLQALLPTHKPQTFATVNKGQVTVWKLSE